MIQKSPTIMKQIIGAIIGGSIALGLYYSYNWGEPKVRALLVTQNMFPSLFENQIVASNSLTLSQEKKDRIQSRIASKIITPQRSANTVVVDTRTGKGITPIGKGSIPIGKGVTTVYTQSFIPKTQEIPFMPHITNQPITAAIIHKNTADTPALPNSGLGISAVLCSAIGSAFGIRRQKNLNLRKA